MPSAKRARRDLTGEYRRECVLRNPAFIEDRNQFLNRWKSEPGLFADPIIVAKKAERGHSIRAIQEQQRKQGQCFGEAMKLFAKWPSVTLADITGAGSDAPGPKVQVAFDLREGWPRDGSILLRVSSATTGEEIKQQWQRIKNGFGLSEHRLRGNGALKIRIYDLYFDDHRTFTQIAKELGKSVSSVYGLFISACMDIGHVRDQKQKRIDLRFDHRKHFSACVECIKGNLCRLAEEKIGLKVSRQQELSISTPTYNNRDPDKN
jgi:hypothetical protein